MRLWVKRGFNGTPASILLDDQDLIDDVKDAVFRKYPVALARSHDSPDVSVCIVLPSTTKPNTLETKILAVDDCIGEVMRHNYPSGQRIEEALVIQVPSVPARRSPYVGPARSSNSPLAGAIGLMTQDMQDFEYFPETPPVHGEPSADYVNNGRNYVPSNYSSGSHSAASFQSQQLTSASSNDGSFRPAPNITMNSSRYVRERGVRPGMGNRAATGASSNNSVSGHNRTDSAVVFYAKQGRTQRAPSNPKTYNHHSPRQGSVGGRADEVNAIVAPSLIPSIALGDERSMSPSVVPLSEQELSATAIPRQLSISMNTMSPLPETVASTLSPISPATRTRRDTSIQSPRPGAPSRPALARTTTASKLSMVSPAGSTHSSTHSVPKVEVKPKPAQAATFGVGGLLEGVVPPIVVLIVEDNMINQRILETFMKRCKIRCLTAKNGREAVDKWKKGGVHLVLMDIQMPVMSGIEAAKEIRRLERTNSIGVFSKKEVPTAPVDENDVLTDLHFRSPVIIVALTASSLQSDRHEALAAGCNDFLTKPVNLVWLEKKVLEWGCMQALIDFEGWRKFRGLKEKEAVK